MISILQKFNARLEFLHSQFILGEKLRKTLCLALIQCHIDYGRASWYSGLSKTLARKLQNSQNKMVQFIKKS